MNTQVSFRLFVIAFFSMFFFISCEEKIDSELRYEAYEPVYMTRAKLESSIKILQPQKIHSIGKVISHNNYIFVNDPGKGIHIINNHKPKAPKTVAFLQIPGNYDIAIQNNLLFADNATDLLAFSIKNINVPVLLSRSRDAFEEVFPEGNPHFYHLDPHLGIIVDWKLQHVVEKLDPDGFPEFFTSNGNTIELTTTDFSKKHITRPFHPSGLSNSLSRLRVSNNQVYTLLGKSIGVYQFTNPIAPIKLNTIATNKTAETLFLHKEMLFAVGKKETQLFSLEKPESPAFLSSTEHWTSSSSAVLHNKKVILTHHTSTDNKTESDQLSVLDLQNVYEPKVQFSFAMTNPLGLALYKQHLYICDGNAGLKIHKSDTSQKMTSRAEMQYPEIHAVDIIPLKNTLLLIFDDGIKQYAVEKNNTLKEISLISIN